MFDAEVALVRMTMDGGYIGVEGSTPMAAALDAASHAPLAFEPRSCAGFDSGATDA